MRRSTEDIRHDKLAHEDEDDAEKEEEEEDEELPELERYSSSDVIVAAQELKFTQQRVAAKVANEVKTGKKSVADAAKDLKAAYNTMAHQMDKNELQTEYKVDFENGLESADVEQRQKEHGLNQLTPPKELPWWLKLLKAICFGFF